MMYNQIQIGVITNIMVLNLKCVNLECPAIVEIALSMTIFTSQHAEMSCWDPHFEIIDN